jgi:hypothetical protein
MQMEENRSVTLHPIRIEWMIERVTINTQKYLQKMIDDVGEIPFVLSSIGEYAMEDAVFRLVRQDDLSRFIDQTKMFHLSSTWHWKTMFDDGPHLIRLPGREPLEVGRVEPNASVDLNSWLNGIYLAMILRDIDAVKVYGTADPEWIIKYTQLGKDPWEIPYIKFLNSIWAFDTNLPSYLKEALRGTDPGLYDEYRGNFLLHIVSPILELWATVFSTNDDLFNETLYNQQKTRHDWFAALDEESGNSIMEYIDLAALAAVCYAHDKGMKIEVQSEYLPEFLIKGEYRMHWPDLEWVK